jgi:putative spermidine/putrescine transport system substrate-binding protein
VEDDVVYFSGAYAKTAKSSSLIEKIDTSVVTNISELYDFALNDTGYGPMVLVGRFGIMYNEDILKEKGLEPPTSYMELLDDKYAGLVSLPAMTATAGPYVLIAIAEQLGGGIDNYQPALDLYKEKKDNIKLWYTPDLMAALSQKEVAITVIYGPDAAGSGQFRSEHEVG